MNLKLIQGRFSSSDALELIAKMAQVKIEYHENKICNSSNEEDIKARELKIKNLQQEMFEIRKHFNNESENITLQAVINIE